MIVGAPGNHAAVEVYGAYNRGKKCALQPEYLFFCFTSSTLRGQSTVSYCSRALMRSLACLLSKPRWHVHSPLQLSVSRAVTHVHSNALSCPSTTCCAWPLLAPASSATSLPLGPCSRPARSFCPRSLGLMLLSLLCSRARRSWPPCGSPHHLFQPA